MCVISYRVIVFDCCAVAKDTSQAALLLKKQLKRMFSFIKYVVIFFLKKMLTFF
jgi:hypothetical protein